MTTRPTLLLQERPLIVLPQLACAVGLNEAIVLQQLHYWLIEGGTPHEGRRWVYNSYEQWQVDNFPFWSLPTIRRVFGNLERDGLISSRVEYDRRFQGSRRKWYTINYDAVREKEGEFLNGHASRDQVDHDSAKVAENASRDQVDQSSRDQSDQTSGDQNDQTLYTENTTENTKTAAAPKNGAIKPSTKRKREPGVLKTLEELTPMQRTVATEIFSLREGQRASKKTMVLINMVLSELYARFGKEHVTPEQLRAALAWYMARPGAVRPKDGAKVANMVSDYCAQHRPAAASAIVRDPDCAVCGGTGLVLPALGAYEDGDPRANTPIQCPVCAKAARASEAQREAVGP